MIEVFKTNVKDKGPAQMRVDEIRDSFLNHVANFDLEDCDYILRVKCATGCIESAGVIALLRRFGYLAEVLPDGDQSVNLKIASFITKFIAFNFSLELLNSQI